MKPLFKRGLLVALLSCAFSAPATASGARWVTGNPWYTWASNPIYWYTDSPQYFTDPGDLSPYVNHAAADAVAAAVWTIPTSRLNLLYGGALDEHASSANVYPTGTGIVFPADVQSNNYLNKQIAASRPSLHRSPRCTLALKLPSNGRQRPPSPITLPPHTGLSFSQLPESSLIPKTRYPGEAIKGAKSNDALVLSVVDLQLRKSHTPIPSPTHPHQIAD